MQTELFNSLLKIAKEHNHKLIASFRNGETVIEKEVAAVVCEDSGSYERWGHTFRYHEYTLLFTDGTTKVYRRYDKRVQ